ncbi:hypothetical protein NQ317_019297 [Molorchus minor]|uniref:Mutator-like transposase domain-containing protein n=1 Tax=Molorchus minor TaxID=1323400 RepID=A0ABQ9J8C1_9CUCU|nr:hypothetical protein NQ317_019297 [Molorchus minor]
MGRLKTSGSARNNSRRAKVMKNIWKKRRDNASELSVPTMRCDMVAENRDKEDGVLTCDYYESDKENNFNNANQESVKFDDNSRVVCSLRASEHTNNESTSSNFAENNMEQAMSGNNESETQDIHGHTFISQNEYESVMEHEPEVEKCLPKENNLENNIITGQRIVDLNYVLKWALSLQAEHSKICSTGNMQLVRENRFGLVSQLHFRCNVCNYEAIKHTEDPENIKSKINYGAVWGTLATGSTYTHLKEQLSVLDIPSLSYRLFHRIEIEIGDHWKSYLWASIEDAGKEEYRLAFEKQQFDRTGNVWTKVYIDGGWSHRSYGHNYNAASGTAIIIGALSGKVLFLGVRNKYCSVCAHAANRQRRPNSHICFKNWTESSGAMEADIVVEGFKHAQVMHNLKYLKFVADGDSNKMSHMEMKSKKIECKNHAIKNYGRAMYKIKSDTTINAAGRKFLSVRNIKHLQNIALTQLNVNANGDVEKLKQDFANGPNHVFGNHLNCNQEYCNLVGNVDNNKMPELESTGIHHHINGALGRLIGRAHKLITNETNNAAELFMSFLAKFNSAKRLNLTQRGSFESRAHISGIKYNEGIQWQATPWKQLMAESPGKNFKKYLSETLHNHETRVKRRQNFEAENKPVKRRKRTTLKSLQSYGPHAIQAPLSKEELLSEKNRILRNMQILPQQIRNTERETVGQWENPLYQAVRKNRLTASNFGTVIKRRSSTKPDNLVKTILGINYAQSEAINYGKIKESVALQRFAASRPQAKIQTSGIFIDETYGYLAASPDGKACRGQWNHRNQMSVQSSQIDVYLKEVSDLCRDVKESDSYIFIILYTLIGLNCLLLCCEELI